MALHLENLVSFVSIFGYKDKVLDGWRVDFFVFGRDKESCYTDQLDNVLLNFVYTEVTVNQVYGDVKGFGEELELAVDVDKPVDEDCAHVLIHMSLALHVCRVGLGFALSSLHMVLDFGTIFADMVNISLGFLVNLAKFVVNIFLDTLVMHELFGVEANLWQLVSGANSALVRGGIAIHRLDSLTFHLVKID